MDQKYEKSVTVGADDPNYRVLATLLYYVFMGRGYGDVEMEARVTRPRVEYGVLLLRVLWVVLAMVMASVLLVAVGANVWAVVAAGMAGLGLGLWVQRRPIVIGMVRLYQIRAAAEVRAACPMNPSCSEYMILAVRKYGVRRGVGKGLDRVRGCGVSAKDGLPRRHDESEWTPDIQRSINHVHS